MPVSSRSIIRWPRARSLGEHVADEAVLGVVGEAHGLVLVGEA